MFLRKYNALIGAKSFFSTKLSTQCLEHHLPLYILQTGHKWSSTYSAKPFYITTPIFYANASPHIGHLYNLVYADILKRWQLLNQRKAILCTGTDEHGIKVQRAAEAASKSPKDFCDSVSENFRRLAKKANVQNDYFIRTTDDRHKEAVYHAWHKLKSRDLIYEDVYQGWYSTRDETFYPEDEVKSKIDSVTGDVVRVAIETGTEVTWISETNYRFRLSAFKDQLMTFYESNPAWILPQSRRNMVLSKLSTYLNDFSISRPASRVTWGIPVPDDNTQVLHVWFEALLNYLSAIGYPWMSSKPENHGWPADCQVIGKDIVWFHAVHWPALLLALELPLPRRLLSHSHWLVGNLKMSKSAGTVIDPFSVMDTFGVDTVRFYLAHDGSINKDMDYSYHLMLERYRKWLAGGLGNLLSRVTRSSMFDLSASVRRMHGTRPTDERSIAHVKTLEALPDSIRVLMEKMDISSALKEITHVIQATNVYLQEKEPWHVLRQAQRNKQDNSESESEYQHLDCILYVYAESLRILAILLQPFVPQMAQKMLDALEVASDRRSFEFSKFGTDDEYCTSLNGEKKVPILFPPLNIREEDIAKL